MRVTIDVDKDCSKGVLFMRYCEGKENGGVNYSSSVVDFSKYEDDREIVIHISKDRGE